MSKTLRALIVCLAGWILSLVMAFVMAVVVAPPRYPDKAALVVITACEDKRHRQPSVLSAVSVPIQRAPERPR
jgi:hypothetical protein